MHINNHMSIFKWASVYLMVAGLGIRGYMAV